MGQTSNTNLKKKSYVGKISDPVYVVKQKQVVKKKK